LTDQQREAQAAFRNFVDAEIVPHAAEYDRAERIPPTLIRQLAGQKLLGALLPREYGGSGIDMLTYGLLHEEMGRGCSSTRSLLTVHDMSAQAILRWGSREQREQWLPRLATGEVIAAFCLTEPGVGSNAKSVKTCATAAGSFYILNGRKKWITFGQIADVFLIFAQCEGRAVAFLIERDTPGVSVNPIFGMLGVRASMLAEIVLEECRVPQANLIGRLGFGFSHIASTALDLGRYTVAWGCVGIGQACLEASLSYADEREQFGVRLIEHQLVQQMLTDMIVNVKAARLLCYQAARSKEARAPEAIMETTIAKYFASTMATRAAGDAVQIHGANGCSSDYPVQRYLRDAKIMEIIEGSTQMQQITIAKYGYQEQVR
jgi:alkylation response protein AidB-like acyl-CoA dehydrogenase